MPGLVLGMEDKVEEDSTPSLGCDECSIQTSDQGNGKAILRTTWKHRAGHLGQHGVQARLPGQEQSLRSDPKSWPGQRGGNAKS